MVEERRMTMPDIDEVLAEDQRPALRFDIDVLREARASLGPIQSTVVRPRATFEGLIERTNRLQKRAGWRNAL